MLAYAVRAADRLNRRVVSIVRFDEAAAAATVLILQHLLTSTVLLRLMILVIVIHQQVHNAELNKVNKY